MPHQTRRTVLLVEDEWLIRMDVAGAFENDDWAVLETDTAEEALQVLREAPQIDLIVSDIRLAGEVTGWDLAVAARELRETFAVIYLSANSIERDRMVPHSVFLEKPAHTDHVLQVARRLLGFS